MEIRDPPAQPSSDIAPWGASHHGCPGPGGLFPASPTKGGWQQLRGGFCLPWGTLRWDTDKKGVLQMPSSAAYLV